MKFLSGSDFSEQTTVHAFPGKYSINSPVRGTSFLVSTSHAGTSTTLQLSFTDVLICSNSIQLEKPLLLHRQLEEECVEMIFVLQGNSRVHLNNDRIHTFQEGECNLYYGCCSRDDIEMHATDGKLECLVIHFSINYYLKFFQQAGKVQQRFASLMQEGKSGFMQDFNGRITPGIMLLINEIRYCSRVGVAKRIFLEARVLELLLLLLEQAEVLESSMLPCRELERMTASRKILEENLHNPPTIPALSRQVGMSETHLKKLFKQTFGVTIYGYVSRLRMERARHLLLEDNMPVSETAEQVGYKNPQHFGAAFKKYYGMAPGKLKKSSGITGR